MKLAARTIYSLVNRFLRKLNHFLINLYTIKLLFATSQVIPCWLDCRFANWLHFLDPEATSTHYAVYMRNRMKYGAGGATEWHDDYENTCEINAVVLTVTRFQLN